MIRRWACRVLGHRWLQDTRGSPVIPVFAVCGRCGKWTRIAGGSVDRR